VTRVSTAANGENCAEPIERGTSSCPLPKQANTASAYGPRSASSAPTAPAW